MAARFDALRGHYCELTYGLPTSRRPQYARLLRERYGIELHAVAGCIASNAMVSYVHGYNEVSTTGANRKFGCDIFKECAEDARRIWDYQASHRDSQWQKADQLCGTLEFVTPKSKTIVINGRTETRLYENHIQRSAFSRSSVLLMQDTPSDNTQLM